MALTECPECESQISSKAESCPLCGHPIRKKRRITKAPQPIIVNQTTKGCFDGCNGCLGQFIWLIVIALVYGMFSEIFKAMF